MPRAPFTFALLWTTALMVAFSIPGQAIRHQAVFPFDKLFHFFGFMVLAILWARASRLSAWRMVLYGVLFAFFTEIYQRVMPIDRSFDLLDILADLGGLVVGVLISHIMVGFGNPDAAEQL